MEDNALSAELRDHHDMDQKKRSRIGQFADTVRHALRLPSPIAMSDLERAIDALGGRVVDAAATQHEASIVKTPDGFQIALDRSKPATRQLFSLGHELGHLFIHMGFGNADVWSNQNQYLESYARSGYDEEEFVAHEFAASLLMPVEQFGPLVKQRPITDVARYFGVSQEAALMRARWLGLLPWS